jgi:hypothetical protein
MTVVAVPTASTTLFSVARADRRKAEHEPVRLERQVRERRARRYRIERLERRPQQHEERQADQQHEVKDAKRRHRHPPAPSSIGRGR